MSALLQAIEEEELIFYHENCYDDTIRIRCRDMFRELQGRGIIRGNYSDDCWMVYSGVKSFGVSFKFDHEAYRAHAFRHLKINISTLEDMLRCYAVFQFGSYIAGTIDLRVQTVIQMLTKLETTAFRPTYTEAAHIREFLEFIAIPETKMASILNLLPITKAPKARQRTLSQLINYLAIENEIRMLYEYAGDESEKLRWFPIFFWVNITFILPLRATEMLVTPYDCLFRKDGKVYLRVRRTKLKGRHNKIYYDVDQDYEVFTYEMPDNLTVRCIEAYQRATAGHKRRFLFDYNDTSVNRMLSLQAFNRLLADFVQEKLIGNPSYDFTRFAVGIEEFEAVTAGDSRPIAMSNLYFQNAGADICRQLAGHVEVDTSAGYYTNVTETLMCSSVMQLQRRLNRESFSAHYPQTTLVPVGVRCLSRKRLTNPTNIEDCVAEKHIADCFGCKYYVPEPGELLKTQQAEEKKTQKYTREFVAYFNKLSQITGSDVDIEALILQVYTHGSRYKMCCDMKMEELYQQWEEKRNTVKKPC